MDVFLYFAADIYKPLDQEKHHKTQKKAIKHGYWNFNTYYLQAFIYAFVKVMIVYSRGSGNLNNTTMPNFTINHIGLSNRAYLFPYLVLLYSGRSKCFTEKYLWECTCLPVLSLFNIFLWEDSSFHSVYSHWY